MLDSILRRAAAAFCAAALPWFAAAQTPLKMILPLGPGLGVDTIMRAIQPALATPEVREAMARQGNAIAPTTPEVAAKYFRSELARYGALVRKAGLKAE
jgi:tripartite-type tricarboxylate transporter receptor subunit TctC